MLSWSTPVACHHNHANALSADLVEYVLLAPVFDQHFSNSWHEAWSGLEVCDVAPTSGPIDMKLSNHCIDDECFFFFYETIVFTCNKVLLICFSYLFLICLIICGLFVARTGGGGGQRMEELFFCRGKREGGRDGKKLVARRNGKMTFPWRMGSKYKFMAERARERVWTELIIV